MSDDIDRAQERTEQWLAEQIARRAHPCAQPTLASADCIDCGIEIPAARRAAAPHCCRCIACQTAHERKSGGRKP